MIHARPDYSRFQDPALADPSLLGEGSTPIAEDEPVMLFRAQDRLFVSVLQEYAELLNRLEKYDMMEAVNLHIELAMRWQEVHGCKTPDMPTDSKKE